MQKKNLFSNETIAGLFVVVGLMVLTYMTIKLGNLSVFGEDAMELTARFSTVSGLRANNPVEMHGIEVGHVADLTIDQDLQMAVATLNIRKGVKVYSDAIASIKTAGLIGDKYVNLDPGGSGTVLENGDVIINTESPADLGELIGKYAFGSVDSGSTDQGSGSTGTTASDSSKSDKGASGLDLDLNLNE